MYCVKCGCKINPGEKRCPDCGLEVTETEYCGGFWGLVGEEENKMTALQSNREHKKERTEQIKETDTKAVKTAEDKTTEKLNMELQERRKKELRLKRAYKERMQLLSGILIAVLLICLIQTVRVSLTSGKYKKLQAEYDILTENNETLHNAYTKLNKKYREIKSEYEELERQSDNKKNNE